MTASATRPTGEAAPWTADELVERLRAQGVEVEALFFPDDHQPPLHHEYQFDLDSPAGRLFLDRLLAFLRRRLA